MIAVTTWDTLFEGKYGQKELTIFYSDDYFVSILRLRDQSNVLIQLYKIFAVNGDIEIFAETLPNQCIVYEKHFGIGENNTYKFFIVNTETEIIDSTQINYHIEKKMLQLNKATGSIVSIIKSYNIKLLSLKMLSEEVKNFFFSDPFVIKVLTNSPNSIDFSTISSVDKLLLGRKNGITINASLENLRSVLVIGGQEEDRIFAIKVIAENYLLSSKKVIVFDNTGVFKTLSYPQQKEELLLAFEMKVSPFGFPSNVIDYFKIKLPLSTIPKIAFISIFKLSGVSEKIINKAYTDNLKTIQDLKNNVIALDIDDEITDFEKWRVISKLNILEEMYGNYFGDTNLSIISEAAYKNIGSSKIFTVNKNDPMYVYYIYGLIKQLSQEIKEEILIIIPQANEILNNAIIGGELLTILKESPKLNYCLSSEYANDFMDKNPANVTIEVISGNDAVIRYPDKDPLRLFLRPTLTSSNIEIKKEESIV
ncbi:MAG: hypothetical protein WCX82_01230 [archaeon]|jgi:hypothetical protein